MSCAKGIEDGRPTNTLVKAVNWITSCLGSATTFASQITIVVGYMDQAAEAATISNYPNRTLLTSPFLSFFLSCNNISEHLVDSVLDFFLLLAH